MANLRKLFCFDCILLGLDGLDFLEERSESAEWSVPGHQHPKASRAKPITEIGQARRRRVGRQSPWLQWFDSYGNGNMASKNATRLNLV